MVDIPLFEIDELYTQLFTNGMGSVTVLRKEQGVRQGILTSIKAVWKGLSGSAAEQQITEAVQSIQHSLDELKSDILSDIRILLDAEDKLWDQLASLFLDRDQAQQTVTTRNQTIKEARTAIQQETNMTAEQVEKKAQEGEQFSEDVRTFLQQLAIAETEAGFATAKVSSVNKQIQKTFPLLTKALNALKKQLNQQTIESKLQEAYAVQHA
ncbi:hypothetical protein GF342_01415 [Candidatus Woesearchaeota archaeon]|nr:hypothetical protein [Candidatus Woesearchaeota archaeon]